MTKLPLFIIMALISVNAALAEYYFGYDELGTYVEGNIQITAQMEIALEQLVYTTQVQIIGDYTRVYYDDRYPRIEYFINRIIQILERNSIDSFHIQGVIIPFCTWDYGRNEKVGFYINNGAFTIVRNHPLC